MFSLYSVLLKIEDLDLLFCILSLAQQLTYLCSVMLVNEFMLQIGKEEWKKERNKGAHKMIFGMTR